MGRGWKWESRASHTVVPWTWERKLLFLWVSGGTETKRNKGLSSRPSTGGRSGAVLAVSWERANSIISRLPASGLLSWAQVHRDRSLHLGNACGVPPGSPTIDLAVKGAILDFVSSSCTSGKKGTGAERGCEPLPAPRNQSSSCEGSGLGGLLTSSPILTAARASMFWVRCGGGDNTRGGQPHRSIPRCCNRHPILGWRTEWNAGRHVEWTSEITREPDGTFAAWGVRGPWGRTRRRGSYCYPQISQSASRWFSARARETSAGGSRGCQSFQKGKARSQRSHAHTPTTGAWVIHESNFVGSPDTEDNDRVHQPQTGNDRNQKDTDETTSWKRCDRPWFALLEFALLVEVPRGIAVERDSADCTVTPTRNKTKMNGFVEISTLLIHSAPKQKSNEWMHLSPFYTRMHGEWFRYAKSTSQFHWRFFLSQRWWGLPSKSLCQLCLILLHRTE